MLEYATLINTDFKMMLSSSYQELIAFVTEIPAYWYIAALALLLLLVKLLANRKT